MHLLVFDTATMNSVKSRREIMSPCELLPNQSVASVSSRRERQDPHTKVDRRTGYFTAALNPQFRRETAGNTAAEAFLNCDQVDKSEGRPSKVDGH